MLVIKETDRRSVESMVNVKSGRRKEDLSDESTAKVLKISKSLIRSDHGGQNAEEQIKKKAAEAGIELGPKGTAFVKKMIEDQIESCRKRAFPRLDEAIRRLEQKEKGELEVTP